MKKSHFKFRLPGESTLRVAPEKIVATVSSKQTNTVDLYLSSLNFPIHIPANSKEEVTEILDTIWDRTPEITEEETPYVS
jgi:hypothetical protein